MKAIVIDGEFGLDHLKIVDRPEPKPRRGEVVIRMSAVSLNYRDTDMVAGTYPFKFPLPLVPTSDGVGKVVAVGDGVTRAKVGDRVLGTFWQSWLGGDFDQTESIGQLGGSMDGMLQEFVCLDQEGLVHAPEHLTDEEAATLPCAALTVWQALVTEGRLKAGETVLVQGTGGISIFALQFAVMFGARSIVTSSSDAKLEKAKKLGATNHQLRHDAGVAPRGAAAQRRPRNRPGDRSRRTQQLRAIAAGHSAGRPDSHDRLCRKQSRRDEPARDPLPPRSGARYSYRIA